jgi:hypothetical protein
MNPTARSLAFHHRGGFLAAAVERWIPRAGLRADLWHFADALAGNPRDRLFLLVQATSADHVAGRLKKARALPALRSWLMAGGKFAVHGWAKHAGKWTARVV